MSLSEVIEQDDESYRLRQNEVAQWTAECMIESGFEYVAWVPPSPVPVDYDETDTPHVDRLAADYQATVSEATTDPNQAIFDELGPTESQSYFMTLWGAETVDPGDPIELDVDRFGCYNSAWVALYGPDSVRARRTLAAASAELQSAVRSHPDVVEAGLEFRRCMSEAGFPDTSPTAVFAAVDEAFEVALAATPPGGLVDLEPIRVIEREIRPVAERCGEGPLQVEKTVRSELEPEIGERVSADLAFVRSQLDDF